MDKKKTHILARFRGWIQACATLLTNIHLPNFKKGTLYQGSGKYVCVPGLNCYSCPGAAGACPIGSFQAVVGSSKFKFSYYITGILILIGVLLGRFICGFLCPFGWFQELLHKIPSPKISTRIALMTAMLLTFSLTACAESSAAPELDGKTEYELLEVENEILLANNALWEKVFLSMSKNVTDDVISSNYGDVLMSAVEGAKEQFSEEEYEKLKADAEQIRTIEEKIAEISASDASGQPEDAEQGDAFPQFTGKDLDGNDVDNSLFSANAFTVVNFWFNGCKPCVQELDDLSALNERIKEQGGEVVGINVETLDGNKQGIETAKQLLETTGANYRNIYFDASSEAGTFALGIMAFPTTYVFDRNGRIVGEPLLGGIDNEKNLEMLQKTIDEALARDSAVLSK